MANIVIVDSLMGTGKTSWAIEYMNDHPEMRFIYVTPFLTEVERLREECIALKEPQAWPTKYEDFVRLVNEGGNIATTHATFLRTDVELARQIQDKRYTVIIDEALDPMNEYKELFSEKKAKHNMNFLLKTNSVRVKPDGKVEWILPGEWEETVYGPLMKRAKSGNLFYFDEKTLVSQIPPEVFLLPERVFILTYLFYGQYLYFYFRMHGIPFDHMSIDETNGTLGLCEYDPGREDRKKYIQLISVYEDKEDRYKPMNNYSGYDLSKNWFQKAKQPVMNQLKNHIGNYLRNLMKAKNNRIMWTTFENFAGDLKNGGYIRTVKYIADGDNVHKTYQQCFLPFNTRATNDYRDRDVLAFVMNCYAPVYLTRYYRGTDPLTGEMFSFDDDRWSLSCLLQWIFRSAIRDGKAVNLYLPSARMRQLLQDWADYKL